jgi:protein-tyrosine-phosphatase
MAEGILRSLMAERGITNIKVSSAGVGALEGMPATPFAIEAAKVWEVDISSHVARQLNTRIVDNSDLILVMSPEHYEAIKRKMPQALSKTYLYKGFPEPYSVGQEGVHDPIGGTLNDYNQTYMELEEILRRVEGRIIQLAESFEKNQG